jgi:phage tail sheath protein FI
MYEPNDAVTWRNFTYNMNLFMDDLVKRKAIEDYKVQCDETTNTPDKVDKNAFCGRILIKRIKMAEYIQISWIMCEDPTVQFDTVVAA